MRLRPLDYQRPGTADTRSPACAVRWIALALAIAVLLALLPLWSGLPLVAHLLLKFGWWTVGRGQLLVIYPSVAVAAFNALLLAKPVGCRSRIILSVIGLGLGIIALGIAIWWAVLFEIG